MVSGWCLRAVRPEWVTKRSPLCAATSSKRTGSKAGRGAPARSSWNGDDAGTSGTSETIRIGTRRAARRIGASGESRRTLSPYLPVSVKHRGGGHRMEVLVPRGPLARRAGRSCIGLWLALTGPAAIAGGGADAAAPLESAISEAEGRLQAGDLEG